MHAAAPDTETVKIVSVSPIFNDHRTLENLLSSRQWTITRAFTLGDAARHVKNDSPSVVICERDLAPGSWMDVLRDIDSLTFPPPLIVTSCHADDYLWSEALNLGAYAVLVKPFESAEVIRTVSMALLRWQYRNDLVQPRVRSAAG